MVFKSVLPDLKSSLDGRVFGDKSMSVNGKNNVFDRCVLLLSLDSFSRTIYVSEKSDGKGNGK